VGSEHTAGWRSGRLLEAGRGYARADGTGDVAAPPASDRELARWLRTSTDEAVASTVAAVLSGAPALAHGDEHEERLTAALVAHASALAASPTPKTGGRLPVDAEAYATDALRAGVPISVLLEAYEVGHAALWQGFARYLREDGCGSVGERADALETGSLRFFEYMRMATIALMSLAARETERVRRREASQRVTAIQTLLRGEPGSAHLEAQLGYRTAPTHVGYVVWPAPGSDEVDRDAAVAALRAATDAWQHVAHTTEAGEVRGWVSPRAAEWEQRLRAMDVPSGAHVAWGTALPGADGFRRTATEALDAQRFSGLSSQRTTAYADVGPVVLAMEDADRARALVTRELGALFTADDDGHLVTTLTVYLEELASPTRTGYRLALHPNTIAKRLERIERLLGGPVDRGSLSLRLALALAPAVRAGTAGIEVRP
jgi:hypothetical protein